MLNNSSTSTNNLDDIFDKNYMFDNNLAGALIVSNQEIKLGEEILLDYSLKQPLPLWAKDWYVPALK